MRKKKKKRYNPMAAALPLFKRRIVKLKNQYRRQDNKKEINEY